MATIAPFILHTSKEETNNFCDSLYEKFSTGAAYEVMSNANETVGKLCECKFNYFME